MRLSEELPLSPLRGHLVFRSLMESTTYAVRITAGVSNDAQTEEEVIDRAVEFAIQASAKTVQKRGCVECDSVSRESYLYASKPGRAYYY
jgi:hypothetical protein